MGAIRRVTVDIGILRRRAASEKLLASTTFANTTSELRSAIALSKMENSSSDIAVCWARGCSHSLSTERPTAAAGTPPQTVLSAAAQGNVKRRCLAIIPYLEI